MPPLLDDINEISLTPIQKFYSGANIFVTGGTGFLGQLIIEKLLRSCPDIGNIYILIRGKKNKNMIARFDELLDGVVFDKLKDIYPKYKYKVVPIEGDCSLPDLGITEQDQMLLASEVSVVFHSAATVNFNEKLKTAIDINVKGTKDLLDLCKRMSRLRAVIHVSTAYSNCAENVIDEMFYPTPIKANNLLELRNLVDEKMLDEMTPHFLDHLPNTYAFTKAIAEDIVREEGQNLPVAVLRPSIVVSTFKEPLEGWINNLYGPVGIATGAAAGILRVVHCGPNVNANLVPADMCVNALIALPWEIYRKYCESKRNNLNYVIPIYNYESSKDQPIYWKDYKRLAHKYGVDYPPVNAVWYYSLHLIKSFPLYIFLTAFLHYIPALFMDTALFILGKKTRFITLYNKIRRFNEVISYFNTKTFKFKSANIHDLISNMSAKDKGIYFCDLRKLDWDEYFKCYFKGVRLYLLKDPISTLEKARMRYKILRYAHEFVTIIFGFILIRIVLGLVSKIPGII